MLTLLDLALGARFRTPSGRTGTLIHVNASRARVKFDGEARHVELPDGTTFDAPGKPVDIAAGTEAVQIDDGDFNNTTMRGA